MKFICNVQKVIVLGQTTFFRKEKLVLITDTFHIGVKKSWNLNKWLHLLNKLVVFLTGRRSSSCWTTSASHSPSSSTRPWLWPQNTPGTRCLKFLQFVLNVIFGMMSKFEISFVLHLNIHICSGIFSFFLYILGPNRLMQL